MSKPEPRNHHFVSFLICGRLCFPSPKWQTVAPYGHSDNTWQWYELHHSLKGSNLFFSFFTVWAFLLSFVGSSVGDTIKNGKCVKPKRIFKKCS